VSSCCIYHQNNQAKPQDNIMSCFEIKIIEGLINDDGFFLKKEEDRSENQGKRVFRYFETKQLDD
jgi:hypothetical protein